MTMTSLIATNVLGDGAIVGTLAFVMRNAVRWGSAPQGAQGRVAASQPLRRAAGVPAGASGRRRREPGVVGSTP